MDKFIDLIIPRGSNAVVRHIMANSSIPVMGHADGICHVYVAEDTNVNMALKIIEDSKTQYPVACALWKPSLFMKRFMTNWCRKYPIK